ncbi:MAG TPA: acyl-CoA dehydrogenase family protein [Mycobacteriales bacterium]|jgi:hypothetical protein|nr:acyl-CoA dehydrogenase family protein [Mycobacteriales bacterium]
MARVGGISTGYLQDVRDDLTDLARGVHAWWGERAFASFEGESTAQPAVAHKLLHAMVADHVLALPQPGSDTWARYDALAALGELDLTIGRLAEAHVDALAILREIGDAGLAVAGDQVWGVWAAEPPDAKLRARHASGDMWRLEGRKAWAGGAKIVSHALVTAEAADGPRLFAVDLDQSGVRVVGDVWPTSALSGTDTQSVDFCDAVGIAVGGPNEYIERPGFWYGAAGVAAVWLGGARTLAGRLVDAATRRDFGQIDQAHLGAVAAAVMAGHSALRAAATRFDSEQSDSLLRAEVTARSARAVVETTVHAVIDHVGQALGPGPLVRDAEYARVVADLGLYVRQSHGDRDLAALGKRVAEAGAIR